MLDEQEAGGLRLECGEKRVMSTVGADELSNIRTHCWWAAYYVRIINLTIHFIRLQETLSFAPGQISMASPVTLTSGFGVLEYWSAGKSQSPSFNMN